MLALYTWFLRLLFPWIFVRLAWRARRNRDYVRRIPERFGFIEPFDAPKLIWIHAVSVGEARAAAPLVKALFDRYPGHRILITTMTPTGSATVRSLFGDQVEHCYVPYDYPSAVRRFLDRTRPGLALIMETELWPNLFHACGARRIPLLVTNLRMSESSMRGYLRFAKLARATLAQVTLFAAQSPADADRVVALGADAARVHVTGSIKFELALPASLRESAEVLRGEWGRDRPVWIAASTHEGEEERVLLAYDQLRRRFPKLLLVLVPRHPERFGSVVRLARRDGFRVARRSESAGAPHLMGGRTSAASRDTGLARGPRTRAPDVRPMTSPVGETRGALAPDVEVLIGDTMGELQLFYAASDVAFVGGSLVPTGGHNLLEPAAVGVASVFGPHMFNFAEIAAMALERGAGVQIQDASALVGAVSAYLESPDRRFEAGEAGKKMVEENRGALERTVRLVESVIRDS